MPPIRITEGEFEGWYIWHRENEGRFSDLLGNFYFRRMPDRSIEARMATDKRHSNGHGYLHGGFLMSFIDMAMFAFIAPRLETFGAVTLSCATDFLAAGIAGQPIDATGEILKETGKMIFVRGLLKQGDAIVCSFTGTMRKTPRPAAGPTVLKATRPA
jgi:uncharacterized protein (TIGR00369 family)